MSIWRLLLLLPMTTTKTQLPSYPRPRGSQHRPSGRPRRRRRAGRRPLARRRPRHHHPRRHRHHFFLSKSSSSYYLSLLSLDAVDKIAGKRRERERERESPLAGRLRASLGKERERERLERCCCCRCCCSFFFICAPRVRRRGSGGVREKKKGVFKERRLTLSFGANRQSSRLSTIPSLFSRSPKKDKQKKRREKERQKNNRSLGSFFCVFRV